MSSAHVADPQSTTGLARRPSGILVPDALAHAPDAARKGPPVVLDADARRRVLMTREDQKRIDRVIRDLRAKGFAVVVLCRDDEGIPGGPAKCGQPARNEAGPDSGYGCRCSRVHFL